MTANTSRISPAHQAVSSVHEPAGEGSDALEAQTHPAPIDLGGDGTRVERSSPYPRVEQAVDQVGDQVGQDHRYGEQQEDALQDRVVA